MFGDVHCFERDPISSRGLGAAADPGQVPVAGAGLGAARKPVTFVFVLGKSHPDISLCPWLGLRDHRASREVLVQCS